MLDTLSQVVQSIFPLHVRKVLPGAVVRFRQGPQRQHMVCFCASGGSLRSRKSSARTRPSCSISRTAELSTARTRKARLDIEEGRPAAPSRTHLETSPIRRLYLGPSSSPSPARLGRAPHSAWQLPCAARSL